MRGEAVQRVALDQLHYNGRRLGFIQHREHGDDRWVGQSGGFTRLVEHTPAHRIIRLPVQHLQGNLPAKLLVMRCIHYAQATGSQLALDAETWQMRRGLRFRRSGGL